LNFSRRRQTERPYRVILDERRKLGIRHNPIENTINILWDFTQDFEIACFALDPTRSHEARKLGAIGKRRA
jgi:hypothetical protein